MGKACKCEWAGCDIGKYDNRVKLPYHYKPPAGEPKYMTYCVPCYVRVFGDKCLRILAADDYPGGVGPALRRVFDALTPDPDDE